MFSMGHILPFFTVLLLVAGHSSNDFNIIVFGGISGSRREADMYSLRQENPVRRLPNLAQQRGLAPFGNFVNNTITVCGGGSYIELFCEMFDGMDWVRSLELGNNYRSSAITTFDNLQWTFFSGGHDSSVPEWTQQYTWEKGQDAFDIEELKIDLGCCACSLRRNQTHAIVTKGPAKTYWYQDHLNLFQEWDEYDGIKEKIYISCGLTYDKGLGYQMVIAGGEIMDGTATENTYIYNFEQNNWETGPALPEKLTTTTHIQYQNTFIIIGGCILEICKNFLKYDFESGWIHLQTKLSKTDTYLGSLHIPPGSAVF